MPHEFITLTYVQATNSSYRLLASDSGIDESNQIVVFLPPHSWNKEAGS